MKSSNFPLEYKESLKLWKDHQSTQCETAYVCNRLKLHPYSKPFASYCTQSLDYSEFEFKKSLGSGTNCLTRLSFRFRVQNKKFFRCIVSSVIIVSLYSYYNTPNSTLYTYIIKTDMLIFSTSRELIKNKIKRKKTQDPTTKTHLEISYQQ